MRSYKIFSFPPPYPFLGYLLETLAQAMCVPFSNHTKCISPERLSQLSVSVETDFTFFKSVRFLEVSFVVLNVCIFFKLNVNVTSFYAVIHLTTAGQKYVFDNQTIQASLLAWTN